MNPPQTNSKLIDWGGYLSLTLLLALPLSVLIVRSGLWQQGLILYALSCAFAAALLAIFVILLLLPRFKERRSDIVKRAGLLLPGCFLFVSVFASQGDFPPIHDISTDTEDPPVFTAAEKIRGEGANPLTIKPESIAQQKQAYPELLGLRSPDSVNDSFKRALATAKAMGWEVYHNDPGSGTIEAVDTTAIMAFKDDVVIRVRAAANESVIDGKSPWLANTETKRKQPGSNNPARLTISLRRSLKRGSKSRMTNMANSAAAKAQLSAYSISPCCHRPERTINTLNGSANSKVKLR